MPVRDRTGLTIGLCGSIVLAVWAASAGIYNLDRAIRDVYGLPRQRFVDARARAFAGAFVVVALGTIALTTAAVLAHTPGALALSVGAAVIAMLATYLAVYVVLLGAVLNVELMHPGRPSLP